MRLDITAKLEGFRQGMEGGFEWVFEVRYKQKMGGRGETRG